jgi:hypothetical protein
MKLAERSRLLIADPIPAGIIGGVRLQADLYKTNPKEPMSSISILGIWNVEFESGTS